jgi:methionyl-tRNA formyltransferase
MRPVSSPVKRLASARGIEVLQPPTLRHPEEIERVRAARPDALVVAAYGLLLPQSLLEAGQLGAFNIHASLLPRWRGAAPIQRALLAGDSESGISIMQMDAGLDTGPVLRQARTAIHGDDDAGSLHDRLAAIGAELIVEALAEIESGLAVATAQPKLGITYAKKVDKLETRLDWTQPAANLERAIRAFRPAPGASTSARGAEFKIWRARVVGGRGLAPGEVGDGLVVGCGEDALEIIELQRAGGKRLGAADFLRGHSLPPGERFG